MTSRSVRDRPPVLGVVPVTRDDPQAPGGCAALRELRGLTLVRRAVDCLVNSGRVDRVAVTFERGWRPPRAAGLVVVHDPLYALAPVELVRAVVDELVARSELAGVVPVRPVTDTLKQVDEVGIVTATADREVFRVACSPQAYRSGALTDVGALTGLAGVPDLVRAAGGRIGTVTAPGELFRIGTLDDFVMAEAVLHVD